MYGILRLPPDSAAAGRELEIVADWLNGDTNKAIGAKFGVSQGYLRKLFTALGKGKPDAVKSIEEAKLVDEQTKQAVIEMRKVPMQTADIVKKTGLTKSTIKAYLEDADLNKAGNMSYSEQFKMLSPEKRRAFDAKFVEWQNSFKDKSWQDILQEKANAGELMAFIKGQAREVGINEKALYELIRLELGGTMPQRPKSTARDPKGSRRKFTESDKDSVLAYFNQHDVTVNEIAKALSFTNRFVKRTLLENGVTEAELQRRVKASNIRRGQNISKSLINSEKAKKSHERRHNNAFPAGYLKQLEPWVANYITKQKAPTLFKQYHAFAENKADVVAFFKEAESHLGHKLTMGELDELFPHNKGLISMRKLIYENHPNNDELNDARDSYSSYEAKVRGVLMDANPDFKPHDRHLSGQELDFYYPDLHLAIEISPIASHHSNEFDHRFDRRGYVAKPDRYHLNKFKLAEMDGITLITLFSDQLSGEKWETITKPMLKRMTTGHAERTFYGRQVSIREIETKAARDFLNAYHFHGYANADIKLGIFHDDELVGVATFATANAKYAAQGLIELKRLAYKPDVQVRFGLSKIVSYFEHHFGQDYAGIISYSDNNMGRGLSYEKAGFDFDGMTGPQVTYVNPITPSDNYSWSVATTWGAKSGVIAKAFGSQDLTTNEAKQVVETELPHRAGNGVGYMRQTDCGNKRWIKRF